MSASIEEAIRAYLLTKSAVIAITTTIRPYELDERDVPPGITISVNKRRPCTFISNGKSDLTYANITVTAISKRGSQAAALSQAVENNGTTPGTGLDGCTVTTGVLAFDAIRDDSESDYAPFLDGSNNGHYYCESHYTVSYRDPA